MSREMAMASGLRNRGAVRPDLPALKRHYLSTVAMFRDLSAEQVAALEGEIRMSKVPVGRMVFAPEETGEGLFILKQGAVQIYRISPEGKRFVIANIEPGTFFGEMAFAGQSMYGSFAETMEPSLLCVMSRLDLERLIAKYPSVGLRMMQALAGRLGDAESQLEDLALKSLSSRLATFILRQTSGDAGQMVGLTHNDLAERVGTSRETATQALNELKADGLIAIGRKRIEVLDREGLEAVAESY